MEKKLLLLGSTPEATIQIINYAKSIGVKTIVTDYYPTDYNKAKKMADESWDISVDNLDELEKRCKEQNITGIFSGVDEYCLDNVYELCRRLGKPCYINKHAWDIARNKYEFKQACKEVGLLTPEEYDIEEIIKNNNFECIDYPVVVKPVDKNSNIGISFCYNKEELLKGCNLARSVSNNPKIIVEKMIDGDEIMAVYVAKDGNIFHNYVESFYCEPGNPAYYYSLLTTFSKYSDLYLLTTNIKAIEVLKYCECKEGVAFIQFKIDKTTKKMYATEMGYRMPGDLLFEATKHFTNFDTIKWMVNYSLGLDNIQRLPIENKKLARKCACSYIMWTKKAGIIKRIEGFNEIREKLPIIYSNEYHCVGDHVKKGVYEIMVIFYTNTCEEMCEIIKTINNTVSVYDQDDNDLLVKYTDFDSLLNVNNVE